MSPGIVSPSSCYRWQRAAFRNGRRIRRIETIRDGFSLIELLCVVLVLGIVVATAAPAMVAALVDSQLRAAANEVSAALRVARTSTLNDGRICRVTFDPVLESVLVEKWALSTLDEILDPLQDAFPEATVDDAADYASLAHPMDHGAEYRIEFQQDKLLGAINIVSANFSGDPYVTFDALGRPSQTGSIVLRSGSIQVAIEVEESGRVKVSP